MTIGMAALGCLVLVFILTFLVYIAPRLNTYGDALTFNSLYYLIICLLLLFVILSLAWCVVTMASDYNVRTIIDKVIK